MKNERNDTGYPAGFFEAIFRMVPCHERAWDVGSGLGDVAAKLSDWFDEVIASDVNPEFCSHAIKRDNVHYRTERAEESKLPPCSVDLITVSQTLHHLQLEAFYRQVRRVLRPEGTLLAWCFGAHKIDARVESLLKPFYTLVSSYWPQDREIVVTGYQGFPFPFRECKPPGRFNIALEMNFDDFLAYLGSWSAVRRYRKETGFDPLKAVPPEARYAWERRSALQKVRWPIHIRAGRLQ